MAEQAIALCWLVVALGTGLGYSARQIARVHRRASNGRHHVNR